LRVVTGTVETGAVDTPEVGGVYGVDIAAVAAAVWDGVRSVLGPVGCETIEGAEV